MEFSKNTIITTGSKKPGNESFEAAEIHLSNNDHIDTSNLSTSSSALHIYNLNLSSEDHDMSVHMASSCDSQDSSNNYSPPPTDLSVSDVQDPSVEVLYFHLSKSLKEQEKPRLKQILNDLKDYYTPNQDMSSLQIPELLSKLNTETDSDSDSDISENPSPIDRIKMSNKGSTIEGRGESRISTPRKHKSNNQSSNMFMEDNRTNGTISFLLLFGLIIMTFIYSMERTDHKLVNLQHEALVQRLEMKIKSLEQMNELFCKD